MNRTKIPWVKNPDGSQGYSLNPMTGCLNCIDGKCGGVFPCYAYLESIGRCHWHDLKGEAIQPGHEGESYYPRIHLQRFNQLWTALTGAGIFICDRSDWAASYWPEWCQRFILEYARTRPDVRLYLLTKQPQNLIKFSPFPENCWVGVTATDQVMWNEALHYLTDIKAAIKYISVEPHLGRIVPDTYTMWKAQLGWIIDGSQTKPVKHPPFEWVEEIVNAADRAGIPVFIKPPLCDVMGYHRQGMPNFKG